MRPANELTAEAREALVECLIILARRGRAIREERDGEALGTEVKRAADVPATSAADDLARALQPVPGDIIEPNLARVKKSVDREIK